MVGPGSGTGTQLDAAYLVVCYVFDVVTIYTSVVAVQAPLGWVLQRRLFLFWQRFPCLTFSENLCRWDDGGRDVAVFVADGVGSRRAVFDYFFALWVSCANTAAAAVSLAFAEFLPGAKVIFGSFKLLTWLGRPCAAAFVFVESVCSSLFVVASRLFSWSVFVGCCFFACEDME